MTGQEIFEQAIDKPREDATHGLGGSGEERYVHVWGPVSHRLWFDGLVPAPRRNRVPVRAECHAQEPVSTNSNGGQRF